MHISMLVKESGTYQIVGQRKGSSPNPENIIFALAGPDGSIASRALERILVAARDIDHGRVPQCQPQRDSFYVYTYFSPQLSLAWENAFYVGKGKAERRFSHLKNRFLGLNSEERPPARTTKQRIIDRWLVSDSRTSKPWGEIKTAAEGTLLVATYCNLSELEAFFLEKFLIMRARRPQDIVNDTAGNHKYGEYTCICQPKSFDGRNPLHVQIWQNAIEGFLADPNAKRVDNTLRPSLTFIGLDADLLAFSNALRTVGVVPYDMTNAPENRLAENQMIKPFCSVTGAGDAMLSFIADGNQRNYRFDFRVPPAGLDMTMTLRPLRCDAAAKRSFVSFFNGLSVSDARIAGIQTIPQQLSQLYPTRFIMNINNWPYFKPYAWNADAKDNHVFFSMSDVKSPVDVHVNWIQGHTAHLTMLEAVRLIGMAFR
jgi:hypothetical protein